MYNRMAEETDYPVMVALWERSVRATHDFLAEPDLLALKKAMPDYFVDLDMKLWYDYDQIVGFSGTAEEKLEMLFVEPRHRQKGMGSKIIKQLIQEDGIHTVDVNTQNIAGLNFYLKQGFVVTGESPLDGQGRPYPLTHLTLRK
ncbi:GNAT family N-acetyltransferase [Enterococcus sp. 669A]|uniref:GNAT family N-acetyltransferase n=1 Tax=Candidatus Enterococcus moelleringii TaxID=2815325 RepID=A0ABS3L4L1_9ENTE|nr:GNAT family N-acetyltransferase [Enterococcus sp. 669A]MBO1304554.1 GNAT family N-acetyltransferase [Enterococcus sp. 669A]